MYRKYQLAQTKPATQAKSIEGKGRIEASGRQIERQK